ncbi:glycosyltransferase [Psychroserpens sp. BH13MA-6]
MLNFYDVLFYVFVAIVIVQIIYYGFIFGKLAGLKQKKKTSPRIPVSVIICAKNEAENLEKNLPAILSQSYPDFEVVLINDHSSDDTLEVMKTFKATYDNVKIVDVKPIEAFWGNKKYALTLGIKAAKHNLLLFTDADCKPVSNQWIYLMSLSFNAQKTMNLGYSPYQKIKGSLLNALIRFETFMTAVQYFSYTLMGQPYMGVGRNLAYQKNLFFEANGFMSHMQIKSGDDDLFVNQMATKHNTTICLDKDSFTISVPKKTFKAWVLQKRRHISTASHYKLKHQLLLGLFYISQVLFWILAIFLLSITKNWELMVGLVAIRFITQFATLYTIAKKLNEKDLIFISPILEFFLIIFQFFIFITNLISKPTHWK